MTKRSPVVTNHEPFMGEDVGSGESRVIAVDGTAGSGKSTTAHTVASRLGFAHVNSGSFYRAITWWALDEGLADDMDALAGAVTSLRLELKHTPDGILPAVAGKAVSLSNLRSPEVTSKVVAIAALPPVRELVRGTIHAAGAKGGIVCDGRDIGTHVFPSAGLKLFLVASAEERARRRLLESGREPTPAEIRQEAESLESRDTKDRSRALAPLRRAPDAILIDTTNLSPTEVVEQIVALAEVPG